MSDDLSRDFQTENPHPKTDGPTTASRSMSTVGIVVAVLMAAMVVAVAATLFGT
jgi:hypothetical protein